MVTFKTGSLKTTLSRMSLSIICIHKLKVYILNESENKRITYEYTTRVKNRLNETLW